MGMGRLHRRIDGQIRYRDVGRPRGGFEVQGGPHVYD